MVSGDALLVAAAACLFLIASAIWAEVRFAGYQRLPRQFGLTLKPKAYGPRWLIIWLVPALFIMTLGMIVFLPDYLPPENINGDPNTGVIFASGAIVAAQVFVLWLLVRWANSQ